MDARQKDLDQIIVGFLLCEHLPTAQSMINQSALILGCSYLVIHLGVFHSMFLSHRAGKEAVEIDECIGDIAIHAVVMEMVGTVRKMVVEIKPLAHLHHFG